MVSLTLGRVSAVRGTLKRHIIEIVQETPRRPMQEGSGCAPRGLRASRRWWLRVSDRCRERCHGGAMRRRIRRTRQTIVNRTLWRIRWSDVRGVSWREAGALLTNQLLYH